MKDNIENHIEMAKSGESGAIAELYKKYWRAARAIAYGVTDNLYSAEDIASEAFYIAINSLHTLKDAQKFGPWLRTIVIRTAKHHIMRRSKEKYIEAGVFSASKSVSPSNRLEKNELISIIHEAVENLSQIQREAICLFYFEGYSIEETSQFLNIPIGTLKRRLYDGRNNLYETAKQIINGKKPINMKREQILKQLENVIKKGGDSETLHKIIQKSMRLRPIPRELLSKLLQQHSKVAKKIRSHEGRKEVLEKSQQIMQFMHQPSSRVLDPNHPVGKVASSIRLSLPEFKEWKIDITESAQNIVKRMSGDTESLILPASFRHGTPDSYLYYTHSSLIESQNGYFCTMYEYAENKGFENLNDKEFIVNSYLSDTVVLMWMRLNSIELKSVEELLTKLSEATVPKINVHFHSYDEPRYRSALRMQLGDIPIPAAIGGSLVPLNTEIDDACIAWVQIHLEAWATAQSNQNIDLIKSSSLLNILRNK